MAFLSCGGDADNKQHLLGQHQLQTGIFKSQTFQLLAENAQGYGAYVVASMSDKSGASDYCINM